MTDSVPWDKLRGEVLAVRADGKSRTVDARDAGTLRGCDVWRPSEMADYVEADAETRAIMRGLKGVARRYE
jgi:hypothetical protein